jgi:hypothetical protein
MPHTHVHKTRTRIPPTSVSHPPGGNPTEPAAVQARCARRKQYATYSLQIQSRHTARIRPGLGGVFTAERGPAPHPLSAATSAGAAAPRTHSSGKAHAQVGGEVADRRDSRQRPAQLVQQRGEGCGVCGRRVPGPAGHCDVRCSCRHERAMTRTFYRRSRFSPRWSGLPCSIPLLCLLPSLFSSSTDGPRNRFEPARKRQK